MASPPAPSPSASPAQLLVRILPVEEWERLRAIEPFASRGLPEDPDAWSVLVVERDGAIVGSCSLFTAMHWDCWFIDPHQPPGAHGVILRQLLVTALQVLDAVDVTQVYTGVEPRGRQNAASMLKRFGFKPSAGRLFILDTADAAMALRAIEPDPHWVPVDEED
jgi:hypothetical protein